MRAWVAVAMMVSACGSPPNSNNDAPEPGDAAADAAPDAAPPDPTLAGIETYLKASNPGVNDRFGQVALSADGQTLAVGAPFEDGAGDAIADSGAVYVFARAGDAWSEQAYLKASNPGVDHRFGFALAIAGDGDTIAIGSHGESSCATGVGGSQQLGGCGGAGAVYVFQRTGSAWSQTAYVKASNTRQSMAFGQAVALSPDGSTLAVGQPADPSRARGISMNSTDISGQVVGSVLVFVRSGGTWVQQAYVKASNADQADTFGFSVALSGDGNVMAVGAPQEDSRAKGVGGDQLNEEMRDSGAVYLFRRTNGTWMQSAYAKASNTDSDDAFGFAVALAANGTTLAVGANAESSNATGVDGDQADNSEFFAGAVYVFGGANDAWTQQAYLKQDGSRNNDNMGFAVSLSANGNLLAAAAPLERITTPQQSGGVYVFHRTGTSWAAQTRLHAAHPDSLDLFGNTVSLSGDGATLAVGAVIEDSTSAPAENTTPDSGAVFVYR